MGFCSSEYLDSYCIDIEEVLVSIKKQHNIIVQRLQCNRKPENTRSAGVLPKVVIIVSLVILLKSASIQLVVPRTVFHNRLLPQLLVVIIAAPVDFD